MKITNVEYRRLVTHGEYSNTSIGGVGEVEKGEAPEEALSVLQAWVDEQVELKVKVPSAIRDRRDELWSLERQVDSYKRKIEDAKAKWDEVVVVLAAHGVKVEPPNAFDNMPF